MKRKYDYEGKYPRSTGYIYICARRVVSGGWSRKVMIFFSMPLSDKIGDNLIAYIIMSLTVSLVLKRYMRGVAEMKFSSLFVRI